MKKTLHILFYLSRYALVMICLFISTATLAQQKDTTLYHLNEVAVFQTRQEILQPSKKTSAIDSTILLKYNTSSLAELLSNQSTVHIKSYGNGNIATTSMRGGNASHTALLWNGFNIQNAMLGQPDLSIVPAFLFDNVSLEYGGGSSLWGSGAIGGSICINNAVRFNQGFQTKLQLSAGSFDTKKIAASTLLSYRKIASNTRIYYIGSQNNYSYKDTLDKENPNKQIVHADYITKGLLQELSFKVNSFQTINTRIWYNNTFRNLPSYNGIISRQHQEDDNLKLSGDWNYSKRRLNSVIRLAFFNDRLNYIDSSASIFSNSSIKTVILESDNRYTFKNHTINVGINYTNYQSQLISLSSGSDSTYHHYLEKLAIFASYKVNLLRSKLSYNLTIRKEFTSQTEIPFTGNTGIHYQLTKQVALKLNGNKSFRQPTLNDLYWNPGGNKYLKPEESYEGDGGLEVKFSKDHVALIMEATYFNRHTNNWIIWLPSEKGYFSPRNIAEVYSRGTETKTELSYIKHNLKLKLIVNTSYVLSTSEKAISENDNSQGRQIIYTPRYSGQASILLTYKNAALLFNQTYTGYRFTSTDNSSWLNPYYLANIKASFHHSVNSVRFEFFGSINNLFNKNYVVVANRPMPLRNFEAGLSLQYSKKNKSINNK